VKLLEGKDAVRSDGVAISVVLQIIGLDARHRKAIFNNKE
jgi:hypothetical protein